MKRLAAAFVAIGLTVLVGTVLFRKDLALLSPTHIEAGDALDSLNGVVGYCNGGFSGNSGRKVVDGYNIALKYQCVEFVKRYYFERFDHRMPNSYGHAKDLFDSTLADGALNTDRALLQFRNGSATMPQMDDLLVLDGWRGNPYGQPVPGPEPGWRSSAG